MRIGEIQRIKTENLTETTLSKIVSVAREQKTDPLIRKTVENILSRVGEKDWTGEIRAIFNYVKKSIRYTRDVDGVEYVKTPVRHLLEIQTAGVSYGDCDDMSLLLATLLSSAGYRTRFAIIRTPSNPHASFDHIYVETLHPVSRKWICLDATMKDKPFGWCPRNLMKKIYNI